MGRSFICISHFDITEALQFHLFGPLFYIICFVVLYVNAYELITNKISKLRVMIMMQSIYLIIAALLGIYYILRLTNLFKLDNGMLSFINHPML